MSTHWKFHLWRNTATNYLRVFVRVTSGLIIFRLLYQHFSKEQFGYWSLLWSVFGYTILLDFGLGYTAQRETAYRSAREDWDGLSRLLSTMVWTFVTFGVLILLLFFLIKPLILGSIHISPENQASFALSYWFFFGAMGLCFPLGLFTEALAGMQRLDLVNWPAILSNVVNIVMVVIGIHRNWSFEAFVFMTVALALSPTLINYFMVRSLLPKVSLHPKLFDWKSVKGVLSFSIVAYIITLTNIINSRTDQVVISLCIGVAFVAVYQAGYKISEVFGWCTFSLQAALSPAAAHLRAKDDHTTLRQLVIKSTKLITLIAIPGFAIATLYLDTLIRLITGMPAVDHATHWVGQILLFTTFSSLLTSSCAKSIMMMAGWERPLLHLSVATAVVNLVLSLILVVKFGVVGVALGTLIPSVLIGWFWMTPLLLKFCRITFRRWCREVYAPVFVPVGLSLITLWAAELLLPITGQATILSVVERSVVVMVPVGIYLLRRRGQLL